VGEIDADVDQLRCVMVRHAQEAHSTEGRRRSDGGDNERMACNPRSLRRRWPVVLLAVFAPAAFVPAVIRAAQGELSWRDIESRIQYGYYTEDAAALRGLEDTLAADESQGALHGYYAGLLAWRQAQLAAAHPVEGQGSSAARLAERCVSAADAVLSVQSDFAEALALRAACLLGPADGDGRPSAHATHLARRAVARAVQLARGNPRVLFVDALVDYQSRPDAGGNKERALVKLRQSAAAFERERAGAEVLPGWGAAEAYLVLALDLLDHGEPVAARDALERALLIAPEFAQARRLMARIIGG
jgi:hypothetical protein